MPDTSDEILAQLAENNPELIERLIGRYVENLADSGLDARTYALVRLASLVAIGAPAASFAVQVSMAREAGATDDEIGGVLVALGPTVGTPRVVAAAPHVAQALAS
jgi:alkylhydroperoxidase/carboxymuconolactone decarboxylase family protein YurZ